MLTNVAEQLLNIENFIDEDSWDGLLKIEIDELLSAIKKMCKLTWVACEPKRLRSVAECLVKCRQDILQATGLMPKLKNHEITTRIDVENTSLDNLSIQDEHSIVGSLLQTTDDVVSESLDSKQEVITETIQADEYGVEAI